MSQMPPNSQSNAGSTQLVIVGLVIAIVAVVLVNIYVEMRAASDREQTFSAFQFRIPKDRSETITEKDFDIIQIPLRFKNAFGENVVPESEPGSEMPSGGWGQELEVDVAKGEVLRYSMLLPSDRNSAGSDVDRGYRIFALNVDSRDQPPNLSAGDYIDVLGNFPQRTGFPESQVVMERVEVKRVGSRLNSQAEDGSRVLKYNNISIAVRNEDVTKLNSIQNAVVGQQFNIVVRNPDDQELQYVDQPGEINPAITRRLGLDN